MSFDFSGYVIKGIKVAPSNASETSAASNGLVRDFKPVPPGEFDSSGASPSLVDSRADQYRASILNNPGQASEEYLVFAANSSQLGVLEDPSWAIEDAIVSIPTGTLTVTNASAPPATYPDGTSRLVVVDQGGKSIASVLSMTLRRGDTGVEVVAVFASQDANAGIVELDSATLVSMGGGVSRQRGDTVKETTYYLAASRFWWTRNDAFQTRFGWNGRTQKWEPLKGGAIKNLGVLLPDTSVTLSPRPSGLGVGDQLPGVEGPDAYAMIRLGTQPDSSSLPIVESLLASFSGILVVLDEEVNDQFDFSLTSPQYAGVIGIGSGVVFWNPLFTNTYAGQTIWYGFQQFENTSNGSVGPLLGAGTTPLFISPIPHHTDKPFIRLGFRDHMTTLLVDTDADLALLAVSEGEVGISLTTGQLKFSSNDTNKADPDNAGFDKNYLGSLVYYDGVALNQIFQPTRSPVPLVNVGGVVEPLGAFNDLYIPDGQGLPDLGISGIRHAPDGTGAVPTTGTPGVRPGGDDLLDTTTGLVREVESVGDTILFSRKGAIEKINIVSKNGDLPLFGFAIPKGQVTIAREKDSGTPGSKTAIGLADRIQFEGDLIYFLQADFTPAIYTNKARLFSRGRDVFRFDGTEVFYFSIDGTSYAWPSSLLGPSFTDPFDAITVATSINTVITGTGQALALNGRVLLEAGDITTGRLEIAFGTLGVKDLSGASALGFLPGWRAIGGSNNWLVDFGISVGLFRSPLNKDRSQPQSDFRSRSRLENTVLTDSIQPQQYVFLDFPPLQDVAGYDENKFFELTTVIKRGSSVTLVNKTLDNYEEVQYQFGGSRFAWLESHIENQRVEQPSQALSLGRNQVVEETLLPVLGGSLQLAEDGAAFSNLNLNEDYILPGNGDSGFAQLIDRVGDLKSQGAKGSFSANTNVFSDPNATFITQGIQEGYRLKLISGDTQGSFFVEGVLSETSLEVSPVFLTDSGTAPVSWELYEGFTSDSFDPAIVADQIFNSFNHLPEEPFIINVLSSVGVVPVDATAQALDRNAVTSFSLERGNSVRFGLSGSSVSVLPLTQTPLGTLANNSLFVPLSPLRFTDQSFLIRVGTVDFTHASTKLVAVPDFTGPLASDEVEYRTDTQELRFGSDVISDYSGSPVTYVESFLSTDLLTAGQVELDPITGNLNYSDADMTTYAGITAYWVEQMVTEDRLDVAVSPLVSGFAFKQPLRSGNIVEVSYFVANDQGGKKLDDEGNTIRVTEFLPLFVRLEEATRVNSFTYSFNPTSKTVDQRIEPQMYVGIKQQNFGTTSAVVDFTNNQIVFLEEIPQGTVVQISYAVFEAFGGERDYTASQVPIYRPPFYLEKNNPTFTLETNRTDIQVGQLLRLGAYPFYIKENSYDALTDLTSVTVFPTPTKEVGTRAPANDVLSLITNDPVTTLVDGVPVPTAKAGFFILVTASFEAFKRESQEIRFNGDLRQFAVPGHLMEIAGIPFVIASANLSEDHKQTVINFTSGTPQEITQGTVKISARPVYPPDSRLFLGVSPQIASTSAFNPIGYGLSSAILADQPFELILKGERDTIGQELPGRTLVPLVDYTVDFDTGVISLLEPVQEPLSPGQTLILRYSKWRTLSPFFQNQSLAFPRYRASFSHVTTPSEQNSLLGGTLRATYTFKNPDTFFFNVLPLELYLAEVAQEAATSVSGSTGPNITTSTGTANQNFGTPSIFSERSALVSADRAARVFLDFYNQVIVAFEQILETISGGIIGDRDGKFKFFVGRNREVAPPGYEDQITGELIPRNLWSEVFNSANSANEIVIIEDDNIVNPLTVSLTNGVVDGDFLSASNLELLLSRQRLHIQNDVDDVVLETIGDVSLRLITPLPLPFFRLIAKGIYQRMANPHIFSRLFPEQTKAFFSTLPGIGASATEKGVYSFLQMTEPPGFSFEKGFSLPKFESTFGRQIGKFSNPVLGAIRNIRDIVLSDRRPRARVWAYAPEGFPTLDATTAGKPTIIATPLELKDFPIDPDTNLPDLTQLSANGGTLNDLLMGDPDLNFPGWFAYSDKTQIGVGNPDGVTFEIGYSGQTLTIGSSNRLSAVYVDQVTKGCLITLKSKDSFGGDIPIVDATQVLRLQTDVAQGTPLSISQGDTIFATPPSGETQQPSDPPTQEDLQRLGDSISNYRVGFDTTFRGKEGDLVDVSLPSFFDPSFLGIKEIFGQKPPKPVTNVEAQIRYTNDSVEPLEFPALLGQSKDDSGDRAIPYLATQNTELDRFGEIEVGMAEIQETKSVDGTLYVYPDEVLGDDGNILPSIMGILPPSTLITSKDVTPVANGSLEEGIGDVQDYDLLLVEVDDTASKIQKGSQGILSVGAVSWDGSSSLLEPPRFVTPSRRGDRCRYILNNAMTHIGGGGITGMLVTDNTSDTFMDIASVPTLVLNDGVGVAIAGGLNNVVSNALATFPNTNVIKIDIYNTFGVLVETITIKGAAVTGGSGAGILTGVPTFTDKIIFLPGITGVVGLGVPPFGVGPFDFTISIDTTDSLLYTPASGTDRANVGLDRLTFNTGFDLSTMLPRGAVTSGAVLVESQLGVYTVEGPNTDLLTVNGPSETNGGSPFNFLPRIPDVGTFTPASASGAGDELGSTKVMAFEGFGNTAILPVVGQTITFSALPSSTKDESTPDATGTICIGTGDCDAVVDYDNRITEITTLSGAVSKVQSGDLLVVKSASGGGPIGTTKAGSYLVRHAIEDNTTVPTGKFREVTLQTTAGAGSGWVDIEFPRVISFDPAFGVGGEITISDVFPNADSPSGNAFVTAPGWIYVFTKVAGKDSEVVAAEYSTITSVGSNYRFTLTGGFSKYKNTDGIDIPLVSIMVDFWDSILVDAQVSGMVYLPLTIGGGQGLPSNNVVGYTEAGVSLLGFKDFSIYSDVGTPVSFTVSDFKDLPAVVGADQIGFDQHVATPSTSFIPMTNTPIYENVPNLIALTGLDANLTATATTWSTVHTKAGVQCLVPGDTLVTSDVSTPTAGFHAQAGIFLEPSFPRPVFDLASTSAHVVDATHSLTAGEIGLRDAVSFGETSPENVTFEVRRVRRWHEVQDQVGRNLDPLRYAYEIRRGVATGYATSIKQLDSFIATGGTQLGLFTDLDVNINSGDELRILDAQGVVLEKTSILAIKSGTELVVSPRISDPTGKNFEIYLKQAPVPHEQSHAQLMELITDELILERTADYTLQTGGYVPALWADRNKLYDDNITGIGANNFAATGVQVGDILVVDPAGEVSGPTGQTTPPEKGLRPFGDVSILERGLPHDPRGPSELDDNRGWYRVIAVNADHLEVSPETDYTSSVPPFKVFPTNPTQLPLYGYAVYPTVGGSTLAGTGGVEGQMDLRPTSKAGENGSPSNSFAGNLFSLRPFSYRIIRPSSLFSNEAIDLILMMRERLDSWLENLNFLTQGNKHGSYFVFQRDEHVSDLGSPTYPEDGLGVLSNALITDLRGQTSIQPFTNDSDSLSILDRRFWILDKRLNVLPKVGTKYTAYEDPSSGGSVRPVLPDLIGLVLDNRDRFRSLRLAWLSYRIQRTEGTLASIERFDAQFPERLAKQEKSLLRRKSIKTV